jgi:hypothetical protein
MVADIVVIAVPLGVVGLVVVAFVRVAITQRLSADRGSLVASNVAPDRGSLVAANANPDIGKRMPRRCSKEVRGKRKAQRESRRRNRAKRR